MAAPYWQTAKAAENRQDAEAKAGETWLGAGPFCFIAALPRPEQRRRRMEQEPPIRAEAANGTETDQPAEAEDEPP